MKKFIFTLLLFVSICCPIYAIDIIQDTVSLKDTNTYGVYQVGHTLVLYNEPDEQSGIKEKIVWNSENVIPENITRADMFLVYLEKKDFALMEVTDETEDWVEVLYNSATGDKGWIKKDDPYKFNTWINFYSMYGKKYGLKILKCSPKEVVTNIYGTPDLEEGTDEKPIATLNKPEIINLNVIKGNWMLITVVDKDKTPKTGYIRWRSEDGVRYLFPDIKAGY